ncbi:MAG: manganese/zinc/iron transport system permease protein [Mariniblastus sp.]|jgi:manganese/zinc/iron transport system permease protein
MISDIFAKLGTWDISDSQTVLIAALAAMACSLPGCFLVIRRQSMMGDALSHTVLPGIVVAFLLAAWNGVSYQSNQALFHAFLFCGALFVGILSAVLTEWVRKQGKVEASAALGVVYTSMFALGLLLIRATADSVHIDPECVLYGVLESEADPFVIFPPAAIINFTTFMVNFALVVLFFKELRISAFDPALATTLGINARWIHYGLMAVTAATIVMAFRSVGSILVIAMLITPAATAYLLTDRLERMLGISLAVAAGCALLGHAIALTLPIFILGPLGFAAEGSANTAGSMAIAAGIFFVAAVFLGPRHGVLMKILVRRRLQAKIASDDILGTIYRWEEKHVDGPATPISWILENAMEVGATTPARTFRRLVRRGDIVEQSAGFTLTESGLARAKELIRSHRLWEAYMAKHFELPDDHLHDMAHHVEHFIDPEIRQQLIDELDQPELDPHGKQIPPE